MNMLVTHQTHTNTVLTTDLSPGAEEEGPEFLVQKEDQFYVDR